MSLPKTQISKAAQYVLPFLALSDSSINKRYKTCHRKLEFNKLYGHARAEFDETIATGAGHALHGAWQTYMATKNRDAGIWELMQRYPLVLQKSHFDARSIQACYSAFEEMLAHPLASRYELAYINVLNPKTGKVESRPAVEVPFRITFKDISLFPDRNVPIYWDGFIDAILWDTIDERYVVVDIKTTRKRRNDYSTMFKRDPQCLPYAYVLEKAVGQPATNLQVLYFVVYIDPLEPSAQIYPFEKTQADIERWAFDVATDINSIRMYADMGFFPRQGNSCDTWGPCIYNDVCDYDDPTAIRNWLDLAFGPPDYVSVMKDFNPWFELELTVEGLQ